MISKCLKLVSFHACSINPIQPCLRGGGGGGGIQSAPKDSKRS